VGALLLALAVPRVLADLDTAPDDEVVATLATTTKTLRLAQAAQGRRDALARRDDGHLHAELAALELALAHHDGPATREGAARLERVESEARAALALAPAQPYAWVALVYAMVARGADSAAVAPIYRLAVEIAPREPALVLPRIELGFAALARGALDDPARAALDGQIRIAADGAPGELARLARRRYALAPIRAALAGDPALLARFDTAYLSSVR